MSILETKTKFPESVTIRAVSYNRDDLMAEMTSLAGRFLTERITPRFFALHSKVPEKAWRGVFGSWAGYCEEATWPSLARFQTPFDNLESCRPLLKEGEARKLTNRMCRSLGLPPLQVQFLDPTQDQYLTKCVAYYQPHAGRVVFGPHGRTRWTVIHEIAHHATQMCMGPGQYPHDPEFVGALITLASRFWTIPLGALRYVLVDRKTGWEQLYGLVMAWSYPQRKHVPQHHLWQMAKQCGLQADVNVEYWLKPWLVGRWKEAA